jgi:GcrA cell cycle regulator
MTNGAATHLTASEREQARGLWFIGWSARMIAEAISREAGRLVTRNSIIGLARRGKWPRRAGLQIVGDVTGAHAAAETAVPVAEFKVARKPRAPRKRVVRPPRTDPWGDPIAVAPDAAPVAPEPITIALDPCTIVDLTDHRCKWPIGDPREPTFSYCGAAKAIDGPYCQVHKKVAVKPREATKQRSQA